MQAFNRRQAPLLQGEHDIDAGQLAEHAQVALRQLRRLKREKRSAAHLHDAHITSASQRCKRHGQLLPGDLQKRLAIAHILVRIEQKCVHDLTPPCVQKAFARFLHPFFLTMRSCGF